MSRLQRLGIFLLPFLVLLVPLSWYFFVYVPSHTKYLAERNFRLLTTMGHSLEQRLGYLEKAWAAPSERHTFSTILETVINEDLKQKVLGSTQQSLLDEVKDQFFERTIGYVREFKKDTLEVHKNSNVPNQQIDSGKCSWKEETLALKCEQFFQVQSKRPLLTAVARATVPFASIIEPLPFRQEFDLLILTDEKGNVLYQQSPPNSVQLVPIRLKIPPDRIGVPQPPPKKDEAPSQAVDSVTFSPLGDLILTNGQYKPFSYQLRPGISEAETRMLYGLVRSDRFQSECHAMPYGVGLTVVVLIFLGILSLPFLHVWSMAPKEQFHWTDVVFLLTSALVGSAMLTFCALDAFTYSLTRSDIDLELHSLAHQLQRNFLGEINNVYHQLQILAPQMSVFAKEDDCRRNEYNTGQLPNDTVLTLSYPHFDSLVLLDRDGYERSKWGPLNHLAPCTNVYEDWYFEAWQEGYQMTMPDSNYQFMLQPAFSWQTGQMEAVFSIRSALLTCAPPPSLVEDARQVDWKLLLPKKQAQEIFVTCRTRGDEPWIAALRFKPLSLVDTVVPTGFGYAVIGPDGKGRERVEDKVLFSSDSQRTLQELFFSEAENNPLLRAAVGGRTTEWIDLYYWGKPHRAYVQPIRGFPWTLVVFYEKGLLTTARLELLTVTLALFVLYMLTLVVLAFLIQWMTGFHIEWIWPNRRCAKAYRSIPVVSLLLSLLSIGIIINEPTSNSSIPEVSPLLLVVLLVLTLASLIVMWVTGPRLEWMWPRLFRARYYRSIVFLLLAGLAILFTVFFFSSPSPLVILLSSVPFSALGLAAAYWLVHRSVRAPRGSASKARKTTFLPFAMKYNLAFVSLFLLLVLPPALACFKLAYDAEMELVVKYGQLQFVQALEKKADALYARYGDSHVTDVDRTHLITETLQIPSCDKQFERERSLQETSLYPCTVHDNTYGIYTCEFFATRACEESFPHKRTQGMASFSLFCNQRSWLPCLFGTLKPFYNENSIVLRSVLDNVADKSWSWDPAKDKITFHSGPYRRDQRERTLRLVTYDAPRLFRRHALPPLPLIFPGGLIVLCLFWEIFWFLTRFITNRVFLLHVADPEFSARQVLQSPQLSPNLLLLGPAWSVSGEVLHHRADARVIDLRQMGDQWHIPCAAAALHTVSQVVIEHFDHKMGDPAWDCEKLQLLTQLLEQGTQRLVIASTEDPVLFYCKGEQQETETVGTAKNGEKKLSTHGDPHAVREDHERWAQVFDTFTTLYLEEEEGDPHALRERNDAVFSQLTATLQAEGAYRRHLEKLRTTVETECTPTAFLQKVGIRLLEQLIARETSTLQTLTPQDLHASILDQARGYYYALWSACSSDEQFLLVRLAQSHFVNTKHPALRSLLARRLVRRDPALRLMNETFAQFVIATYRPEELRRYEQEQVVSMSQMLRGPLFIMLIGIGLFLYLTQQELVKTTEAFAAIITTSSLPALFKLLGGFFQDEQSKQ